MPDSIYADYSEPATPATPATPVATVAAPTDKPTVAQERPRKKSGLMPKLVILALLVTAGVSVWWTFFRATPLDRRDLAFLPDDPALIVQVRGSQLRTSAVYADVKKFLAPYVAATGPQDTAPLFEAFESRLDTLTFGVRSPESLRQSGNQQFAGVLRCSQDLVLADFTFMNFDAEETVAGKTIRIANDGAVCQIDARTIAFGTTNSLSDVLQREGTPATISPRLKKALAAANFAQVFTLVAAAPEQAAEEIQMMSRMMGFELPESFVLNADLDSDLRLSASVVMKQEADVEALMKRLGPTLERAKRQSPENKQFVDSLEISPSGATLTIAATVPGSLIREGLEKQPLPPVRTNNVATTASYPSAAAFQPPSFRFTGHKPVAPSQSANTSKFSLQAVRFAIGAFRDDHGGAFPSLQHGNIPGLVQRTSLDAACDDNCGFGPYLSEMPKNNLNGLATIKRPEQVPPRAADGTTGWYYDPQTGGIWLNSNVTGQSEYAW